MIKYANDHPYKLVVGEGDGIYANDHPYKVEIEGGVVTPAEFEELETKVDALVTDLSYKGGVPTYEDLPANPETGDVYTAEDTGILYVWDSAKWVPLNKSQAAITGTDAPTTATEGELGQAYLDTTHQKIYYLAQITSDPTTYVWKAYGPEVVQTTGTSTTDVMSQNAVTVALDAKQDTLTFDSTPTENSTNPVTSGGVFEALANVGIKTLTTADYNYPANNPTSVALWLLAPGVYKVSSNTSVKANTEDVVNAGSICIVAVEKGSFKTMLAGKDGNSGLYQYVTNASTGAKGSAFSLAIVDALTNTARDVSLSANQGRVLKNLIDSIAIRGAGAPTTSTVGTVGQLYEDGTNGVLYQLKSIDITVTPNTYNWEQVGGSSVNVVQTTGTSTTDVMSQNAVTTALGAKENIGTSETITISSWSALSGSDPYDYQATVSVTTTIPADGTVELVNDQAVLFATHGFAIGAVDATNNTVTIYSIGEPTSSVSLNIKVRS